MAKDRVVRIKDIAEQDIVVILPNGKKVTLQYRNYENEEVGTIDVLLPHPAVVYNWKGVNMTPAAKVNHAHVRLADQLCIFP